MERLIDLTLIKPVYEKDQIGQKVKTGETKRELICTMNGITRQEWMAAAQSGLNPEFMAFLRDSEDYEGEPVAEYAGTRYVVYRTYPTPDGGVELYLRKNVGVNA